MSQPEILVRQEALAAEINTMGDPEKLTPFLRGSLEAKKKEFASLTKQIEQMRSNRMLSLLPGETRHFPGGGFVRSLEGDDAPVLPGRLPSITFGALTGEQREQLDALAAYAVGRPSASADLTPGGDGGVLIPEFVNAVIERVYTQFNPVRSVCRRLLTETGAPIKYPVLSDSENAEQVASGASTGADATVSGDTPPTDLDGPTLVAWKSSSKPVFVPRETYTDDSTLSIVNEVIGALIARVIRFENSRFTSGNGSGQAQGFLSGCTGFEADGVLDLDVALDLAYSVPALYRPNGVYMMSDGTAKYLRKLHTGISGDKRLLWADADATKGIPAALHGYPVVINPAMSDVAANGSYSGGELAFGDFSKFVVREAENGQPFIYRYAVPAKDGAAVIVFRRTDSRILVPEAISKLMPSGS